MVPIPMRNTCMLHTAKKKLQLLDFFKVMRLVMCELQIAIVPPPPFQFHYLFFYISKFSYPNFINDIYAWRYIKH